MAACVDGSIRLRVVDVRYRCDYQHPNDVELRGDAADGDVDDDAVRSDYCDGCFFLFTHCIRNEIKIRSNQLQY